MNSINEVEILNKRRKFLINFVYYTLIVILFCLFLRYAFQPLLPLFIASFLAIVLQKPVNLITKKTKIPKGIVSVIMVFVVIGVVAAIVALVGSRLITELTGFVDYIRLKLMDYNWIEAQVYSIVEVLPNFIKSSLLPTINTTLENLESAMAADAASGVYKFGISEFDVGSFISNRIPDVINTAKQIPSIMVAIIICVITSCFMTAEYDILAKAIRDNLPGGPNNIISTTKRVLMTSVWKLLKAYLLIMCCTCVEMLIGLSIFKALGIFSSNYIVAIAIFSAVFDILPILGMGAILWPWAIVSMFTGNIPLGIALIILYFVITVIRQIIEPKLVAGQMSLPPALTISVMYIGLKTFGVIGMFAFTIALYCLKVLDSEGVIHLFNHTNDSSFEAVKENTLEKKEGEA